MKNAIKTETKATGLERVLATEGLLGFQMLNLGKIRRSATNPRKTFDPVKLKELADNIAEMGIIQPLVVRLVLPKFTIHEPDLTCDQWVLLDAAGKEVFRGTENHCILNAGGKAGLEAYYELVAGERRHRAAELAKLDLVPAMVKQMSDAEMAAMQLVENYQRDALLPMEEAEAFADLVARGVFTPETLKEQLKTSRSHVYGRLKLATLPKVIKEAVRKGELNAALAELVARIPGEKLQLQAMKEIQGGGDWGRVDGIMEREAMSVRKAKDHLKGNYTFDLKDVPWDLKDKELVPAAGSCKECPKRSGNCEALFPELKNPNVCTDPGCHNEKGKAWAAVARAKGEEQARKERLEIIPAKESANMFRHAEEPYLHGVNYLDQEQLERKLEHPKAKGKSIEKVLGKDLPKPVAAISPQGVMFRLWDKDELLKGLEEKGITAKKPEADENDGASPDPEIARKNRMAEELRERTSKACTLAVYGAAEKPLKSEKAEHAWWARYLNMATMVYADLGWTWEDAFERRNISADPKDWAKLPVETLRGIAVELLMPDPRDSAAGKYAEIWDINAKEVAAVVKEEYVQEMRLPKHGETVKFDRDLLEGVVEESYSADKLIQDKIAIPFEWKGRRWVKVGGVSSGAEGIIETEIWQVVPKEEYTGETCTYNERQNRVGKLEQGGKHKEADKERESHEGQVAANAGKDWVLCKPMVTLVPDRPLAKEKKGKK